MAKKSASTLVTTGPAKYVAYYRVSTKAQGESGLGLEGQRAAVAGYVKGVIIRQAVTIYRGGSSG